jgi:branched-chain amino acid transport system substrate-binding protein
VALIILAAALPVFAGGGSEAPVKEAPIIGLSAPITGDNAEYGEYFRAGAELAKKLINDKGGINGVPIEILVEDSRSDPKEAVLIAQRFLSNPRVVAVVGDFNTTASMAAAPIYNEGELVQISPTCSHPDFTPIGPYIFRAGITQVYEASYNARWSVKDLGYKQVAILYVNSDWGKVVQENYVKTVKAEGSNVIALESYIPGDKDFTASLTKIKNVNPEVLYLASPWADAALILTQAQKLGLQTSIMGSGILSTNALIQNAGAAAEGVRCNSQYFAGDPRPATKNFTDSYVAMYGKAPHSYSAITHDAFMLLAEAMKKAGTDRTKIRDALAATKDFPGATGTYNFDAERNPLKTFARIQVRNGAWVVVEK